MNNRLQKIYSVYDEAEKHLSKESVQVDVKVLNEAFLSVYSPGPSFQYIFDFNTRSFDFVSPSVQSILGSDPDSFSVSDFVNAFHPDDVNYFHQCEEIARYFLFEFISPYEIPFYKVSYQFRMGNKKNGYKLFLHQSITLSTDANGNISRVLVNHSDISHITQINNQLISFIDIRGTNSFNGINSVNDLKNSPRDTKNILTRREIDILHLISEGLSSQEIAHELGVSYETIKSHRKNILSSTDASNTSQAIAIALRSGWL